jgi:hypothetical protein
VPVPDPQRLCDGGGGLLRLGLEHPELDRGRFDPLFKVRVFAPKPPACRGTAGAGRLSQS